MKVHALDLDDDDRPRNIVVNGKTRCQGGVSRDCCAAFYSQALATARNQKVDGDAWIANYIAQAVDSIVAIAVGDHHLGVINNAYEAREIAAWRAIDAIRTDSCKRQVWGRTNKS